MSKRNRESDATLLAATARAKALIKKLQDVHAGLCDSFLWDTGKLWELRKPLVSWEKGDYMYIPRERAQKLYAMICGLKGARSMQVLGCKGSGKSTVVSAISGYLIASKKDRVVYLNATSFIDDPFIALTEALLVATDGEGGPPYLEMENEEELARWCRAQERGSLLFVVDDWDALEGKPAEQKVLNMALRQHRVVQVSSVNSRQRYIWSESDKRDDVIDTFHFDGPYTSKELEVWVGRSGLSNKQLKRMDHFTGGIPGLLHFYQLVQGDDHRFMGLIRANKLFGNLTTGTQLAAALAMIETGEKSEHLRNLVDFTNFYVLSDELFCFPLFRPLSPFIRLRAEDFIMTQHAQLLGKAMELDDMHKWVAAVRMDIDSNNRNPARVAWNVESLVIGIMRYRREVFGIDFKHYESYKRGREGIVLNGLSVVQLKEGVLLGPVAFNQKAIDVILIKLVGDMIQIVAIQITVAQWKAKSKKASHTVWRDEVLPKWKPQMQVQSRFIYVMPEKVVLDDVKKDSPEFKRLGDIDDSLEVFDEELDLEEPKAAKKQTVKQCKGKKCDGEQCKLEAVCTGDYYCHHHLKQTS